MAGNERNCYYNLEDRTFEFSKTTIHFLRSLSKDFIDFELSKQLVRSACSVGANYIEANEALSLKDFIMRSKICKKEAKESIYWLRLIECTNDFEIKRNVLIKESNEFVNIFGAIIRNSTRKLELQRQEKKKGKK